MLTVASCNCAGLRGSNLTGKSALRGFSMAQWLKNAPQIDILAIQETRVNEIQVRDPLLKMGIDYDDFYFQPDLYKKGHGGVALVARSGKFINIEMPFEDIKQSSENGFSGRWIEGDWESETGKRLKIVCAYLHHADSPKTKLANGQLIDRDKSIKSMDDKHKFMASVTQRIRQIDQECQKVNKPYLIVGDFNIAHHRIDIKNWKSNTDKAGFLPEERAWMELWMPTDKKFIEESELFSNEELIYGYNSRLDYCPPKTNQFSEGSLNLIDVHRFLIGQNPSYTWWSNRGRAFDNDAGWRIDYQMACPSLAKKAKIVRVDKADSYYHRWSDHAPLVIDYNL
ncbi:MAG: endonuclease/exonuclease/phosphatase family protein [Bifidobacteriaceae bacterium]|nr:endonuclease/exonuclease/phosphatase family protein [Bifidobacteriaceae bacterium]